MKSKPEYQQMIEQALHGEGELSLPEFLQAQRGAIGRDAAVVARLAGMSEAAYLACEAGDAAVPKQVMPALKTALNCRGNELSGLFDAVMGVAKPKAVYDPEAVFRETMQRRHQLGDKGYHPAPEEVMKSLAVTGGAARVVARPLIADVVKEPEPEPKKPEVPKAPKLSRKERNALRAAARSEARAILLDALYDDTKQIAPAEFIRLRFTMLADLNYTDITRDMGVSEAEFKAMMAGEREVPTEKIEMLRTALHSGSKYSALFDRVFDRNCEMEPISHAPDSQIDLAELQLQSRVGQSAGMAF